VFKQSHESAKEYVINKFITSDYRCCKCSLFIGVKMKRKGILFSALSILALAALIFGGCSTGFTDADVQADSARTLSASSSVPNADISNTTWLIKRLGDIGVSTLSFDSATTAVGFFVDTTHDFTYSYDSVNDTYWLVETGIQNPPGPWKFEIDGNSLEFIAGFDPYDAGNPVFTKIVYPAPTPVSLETLADTNWLGIGPRGLSLLDDITQFYNLGTLDGSFGADPTESFAFSYYPYESGGGEGTMDGAGDFTTSSANGTMYFPDFWGHIEPVTFYLFTK
jgi:hypothetical protein